MPDPATIFRSLFASQEIIAAAGQALAGKAMQRAAIAQTLPPPRRSSVEDKTPAQELDTIA